MVVETVQLWLQRRKQTPFGFNCAQAMAPFAAIVARGDALSWGAIPHASAIRAAHCDPEAVA
jgi:hypothetical protein